MEKQTIEEYCRLIDKISDNGARSIDIAKELGLSKNTVAITLSKLSDKGYVEKERYGRIYLTPKGKMVAKKMNFRHRVLETFLFEKLGMKKGKIHEEACRMEHAVSDEMVRKLYRFLGEPKLDPHGRKI